MTGDEVLDLARNGDPASGRVCLLALLFALLGLILFSLLLLALRSGSARRHRNGSATLELAASGWLPAPHAPLDSRRNAARFDVILRVKASQASREAWSIS